MGPSSVGGNGRAQRLRTSVFLCWALPILALGALLRVWGVGHESLWSDEIFTVFFARAKGADFLPLLLTDGVHVPLYFALMRLWPSDADLWVRLPSVWAGLLGVALTVYVVRRLYRDDALALSAGALLAVNPYAVWFARMARPYALFYVVALLVSYQFLILLRGERSRGRWLAFTLLSGAAWMTHFFAAALPLAQYVLLVWRVRDRGFVRRWLAAQAVAFVPLVWWLYRLATQDVLSFGIGWIPHPSALDPLLTLTNLGAGVYALRTLPALVTAAVVLVGLGGGAVMALRARAVPDAYWLSLIVVAVLPVWIVSRWRPLYVDRYFMVMLPAVLLLTLRGWWALPRAWPRRAALALVIAFGVGQVTLAIAQGRSERQAWRDVAAYLAANVQPDDGLVLETALVWLPLQRYWPDARLDALPRYEPQDAPQASQARLWTVCPDPTVNVHQPIWQGPFDPYVAPDTPLTHWTRAIRAHVVARRDFNGVIVLLSEQEAVP